MLKKYLYLITILIAALVASYYYVMRNNSSSEIVLLEPEYSSHKKKPKDPGGIEIPNSDSLIYDQLKKRSHQTDRRKVKILPGPEKPIEIEFMAFAQKGEFNSIDDVLANLEFYEQTLFEESAEDDSTELEVILPNDLSDSKNRASAGASSTSDPDQFVDPVTSINVSRTDQKLHKLYSEANEGIFSPGYYIQLTVAKSESEARNMWSHIKGKQGKILANSELVLKKLNGKNDKIFFLVMSGPYPSLSRAKLACSKLKKRGQHCIITK